MGLFGYTSVTSSDFHLTENSRGWWTLSGMGGFVDSLYRTATPGQAQWWATQRLHHEQVRVVRWEPDTTKDTTKYVAVVAPWRGQWEVTQWIDQQGRTYNKRGPDGCWISSDGRVFPDLDRLHEQTDALIPNRVSSLAAMLAELDIYRAVAGYVTGAEDCITGDCGGPDPEHSCDIRHQIASAEDTVRLHHVRAVIAELVEAAQPTTPSGPDGAANVVIRGTTTLPVLTGPDEAGVYRTPPTTTEE